MDPISLIIAAFAAGAISGVGDVASQAVKDAYQGLKGLIRARFAGNQKAEAALDQAERQPESGSPQLAGHLRAVGADGDAQLIKAAQGVFARVDPAGTKAGKYEVRVIGGQDNEFHVQISGGKGNVVGNAVNVTMNFNDND